MAKLVEVFVNKIVNGKTFHLDLFLDENWNCKSNIVSYGHDIESSWLIDEAVRVLGDDALIQKVQPLCLKIAGAASEGLCPDGSLIYERNNSTGHIDNDKHWWVQAEAVLGFLNAYELGVNPAYLDNALAAWKFISDHLVDHKDGEWFWSVDKNNQPNRKDDKAGFWKCPYHDGRMCLEILERY